MRRRSGWAAPTACERTVHLTAPLTIRTRDAEPVSNWWKLEASGFVRSVVLRLTAPTYHRKEGDDIFTLQLP
jgi:hypothetical protein